MLFESASGAEGTESAAAVLAGTERNDADGGQPHRQFLRPTGDDPPVQYNRFETISSGRLIDV